MFSCPKKTEGSFNRFFKVPNFFDRKWCCYLEGATPPAFLGQLLSKKKRCLLQKRCSCCILHFTGHDGQLRGSFYSSFLHSQVVLTPACNKIRGTVAFHRHTKQQYSESFIQTQTLKNKSQVNPEKESDFHELPFQLRMLYFEVCRKS